MDLHEIYKNNKDYIIGSDFEKINSFQKKLINSYILDNKKLKKNESTKHIDKRIINNFSFFLKNSRPVIEDSKTNEKLYPNIIIKNGNEYILNDLGEKEAIFESLYFNKNSLYDLYEKYKNTFFEDYLVNLNSVLLNSSFKLEIKENIEKKIHLSHIIDENKTTVYAKNFFKVKKNSKLILIENFDINLKSNSNIVNYFELEPGSEVLHYVLQNNTKDADLQFSSHTNCQASSSFKQFVFNTCQSSVRNHHYVDLLGQKSIANLSGVFFASDNQIIDNKTSIKHASPDCTSNQNYQAIVKDNAKGSYLSKTHVDSVAQKTEGYQLSKGILLSPNAYFHSKPELKIYADDVKCSHGSIIGPFDESLLFYFRSRGINLNTAKSFLIKSFIINLLEDISNFQFKKNINRLVDNWLLLHIN